MSNDKQDRQPANAANSAGGEFARRDRAETGTQIMTQGEKAKFEADVRVIANDQGWSDETLGELAFGYLINASEAREQAFFLEFLRECADTENTPFDEDYDADRSDFDNDEDVY